jgi:hypothetical protein
VCMYVWSTFFVGEPSHVSLELGVVNPSLLNAELERCSHGGFVVAETTKGRVKQLQLDKVVVLGDDMTAVLRG